MAKQSGKKASEKPADPPKLIGFRCPADLANRLQLTATRRKIRAEEPYTLQAIITAAVEDWLAVHGEDASR